MAPAERSPPQDAPPPGPGAVNGARPPLSAGLASLSVAALGVVFGDIGTSPLYTLKTVLDLTGEQPDRRQPCWARCR